MEKNKRIIWYWKFEHIRGPGAKPPGKFFGFPIQGAESGAKPGPEGGHRRGAPESRKIFVRREASEKK